VRLARKVCFITLAAVGIFEAEGATVVGCDSRRARPTHPLGRLGTPEDVARVALFLASDDAAYLNAVDIAVDGGQSVIV
jgi:hypothetical protein